MADPLNELERQVEGGNLFAHSTLTEHATRINEAAAIVNGLVGLLVQQGLIEGDELLAAVDAVRERTEQAGMVWVCWPKKAAKVPTDLDENVVREIGLAAGVVDVKVCAIDETWSGLKFVRRLADRT